MRMSLLCECLMSSLRLYRVVILRILFHDMHAAIAMPFRLILCRISQYRYKSQKHM